MTLLYDPDLYDAQVKVQRKGCDVFDKYQLAELLGVSWRSIYRLRNKGLIPEPDHYRDEGGNPYDEPQVYRRAVWTEEQAIQIMVNPPPEQQLAPCGTKAAADRHVRRGEPVDEACRIARLEYHRAHPPKRGR